MPLSLRLLSQRNVAVEAKECPYRLTPARLLGRAIGSTRGGLEVSYPPFGVESFNGPTVLCYYFELRKAFCL